MFKVTHSMKRAAARLVPSATLKSQNAIIHHYGWPPPSIRLVCRRDKTYLHIDKGTPCTDNRVYEAIEPIFHDDVPADILQQFVNMEPVVDLGETRDCLSWPSVEDGAF